MLTALQFTARSAVDDAPSLLLLDFTKSGRLSMKDMDASMNLLKKFLAARPLMSMAVVVAPYLESARQTDGHRGCLRQVMVSKRPAQLCTLSS